MVNQDQEDIFGAIFVLRGGSLEIPQTLRFDNNLWFRYTLFSRLGPYTFSMDHLFNFRSLKQRRRRLRQQPILQRFGCGQFCATENSMD